MRVEMAVSALSLLSFLLAVGCSERDEPPTSFDGSVFDAGGADGGGAGGDATPGDDAGPLVDGLSVVFDYRFDTTGYFSGDASHRATLEAAAAAWGRILADDFETIPAGTSIRTRNPETPDESGMSFPADEDIDDVLIFVGCAPIAGGTARSNHTAALGSVADADLQARLVARYRGADFEPWTGWIAFDCGEPWFFDATPESDDDIPTGTPDFFSTAMHEIGHVLGFGTADAFTILVESGAFVGTAAVAAHGGPVPLTPDGVHFDSSLRSDGRPTLLDQSRTVGTRTPPTTLDQSVFVDLGYEVR